MVGELTYRCQFLHSGSRSSRLDPVEIREVYEEEITRGLDPRISREEYLRKVVAYG